MAVIKALRTYISDGARQYPVYLGYLPAKTLADISSVPSFGANSSNADIARNVLNPPVKDWQRPLIEAKWKAIRDKFSSAGELMPNPVLLAVAHPQSVTVDQQKVQGQVTEIFLIDVAEPTGAGTKPLWILDGQHRVKGVSESTRSGNPIPLVLLHGDGANAYSPQQFAKVFAEVTTYATPLDPLHEDWLRYAFKLGDYASVGGAVTPGWQTMDAIARLCELQTLLPDNAANLWHNKIQFNPQIQPSPALAGGFAYSALALKELILQHYYLKPGTHLAPEALAHQLGQALIALSTNDATATNASGFFGDPSHRQKYLQDAFLVGVCNYLLRHPAPASWTPILQTLMFSASDWDVSPWVVSTGGNTGNTSRKVANAVFADCFGRAALPASVSDIPTYLAGDSATISFRASELLASGRAKKPGAMEVDYPLSGNKALNIGARRHLKLIAQSLNIGKLEIVDAASPLAGEFTASRLKSGVSLPAAKGAVRLLIGAEFYGGTRNELTLTVTWT